MTSGTRIGTLVAVALLAVAWLAVASEAERPGSLHRIRVDDYASCAGTTDATAGLKGALAAAAGKTLFVPSGCKLLIGSPGIGGAALTLPSETTILCEDQTAGFLLARQYCRGGRYPGAGCAGDADCLGDGSCVFDSGTDAFARRHPDASFTLLDAAPASMRVAVKNCRIWANGVDDYGRCRGGTNDGRPCLHACDGKPHLSCDAHQDCVEQSAGTTCSHLSDCRTAENPGTCDAAPGVPVGMGKVTLVDLSAATDAVIENVIAYDHRRGDVSFAVGAGNGAHIRWSDNALQSRATWPASFVAPVIPQPIWAVTTGARLVGGVGARLSQSNIRGATVGVSATGDFQTITDSSIEATGATPSTYAVSSEGLGNRIIGNRIRAAGTNAFGVYVNRYQQIVALNHIGGWGCARGGATSACGNVTFAENRCFGGAGPKIVAMCAGWTIVNNYFAWGTTGRGILELGSTEAKADGTTHLVATGNVFHSEERGTAAVKLVDVGRRCNRGSKVHESCTTNDCDPSTGCPGAAGCPSACTGKCCVTTGHVDVNLSNNTFLAADVGVDASSLTSGGTRIATLTIAGNVAGQLAVGVALPADDTLVSGLLIGSNNLSAAPTPVRNFKWTMGVVVDNTHLSPADDTVDIVPLQNQSGSTLTAGDVVEVATTADNAVTQAAAGSTKPIGIALTGAANAAVEKVALRGTTSCNTTDASIARGDRLALSATPGKLGLAQPADRAFAIALTARAAGAGAQSVRCLLVP